MHELEPNPLQANIIGIDLGTDFTTVARVNEAGRAEITNNAEGETQTPSVIQIDASGDEIVGTEAKKLVGQGIENVFTEFKRDMGTPNKSWPVGGKDVSPIDLTAILLKRIVADYAKQYGQPDIVTITFPGNFRTEQRHATIAAAQRAGLKNVRFIEENAAVALYLATTQSLDGKYLICNFGAGTFDVTLIEAHGREVKVLYQDGVQQLGGMDFDNVLLKMIGDKFRTKRGDEFDALDCNFDKAATVSVKHTLSHRDHAKLHMVSDKHGPVSIDLTRSEFEAATAHLVEQAEMACENVLRCGKDNPEGFVRMGDLRTVFLTGGTFRTPFVQSRISALFGQKAMLTDPHFTAAYGAALHAAINLSNTEYTPAQAKAVDGLSISLITPHYLGTSIYSPDAVGIINDTVIAKGQPLPCTVTRTYYAVHANQSAIRYDLTESAIEEINHDFVTTIYEGECQLPPRFSNKPLTYIYAYDINGCGYLRFSPPGFDPEKMGVTANLVPPGPPIILGLLSSESAIL